MMTMVGLVWYRAEDFDVLKAMFVDGEVLPDTFEDWHKTAQMTEETLTAKGIEVVRVPISPGTFPEWCRARGLEMNSGDVRDTEPITRRSSPRIALEAKTRRGERVAGARQSANPHGLGHFTHPKLSSAP
jgi:hypothetical protein